MWLVQTAMFSKNKTHIGFQRRHEKAMDAKYFGDFLNIDSMLI